MGRGSVRTRGAAQWGSSPAAPTGGARWQAAVRRGAAAAGRRASSGKLQREGERAGESSNRARGWRGCCAREQSDRGSPAAADYGGQRRREEEAAGEEGLGFSWEGERTACLNGRAGKTSGGHGVNPA
jgi:hypothetical protein